MREILDRLENPKLEGSLLYQYTPYTASRAATLVEEVASKMAVEPKAPNAKLVDDDVSNAPTKKEVELPVLQALISVVLVTWL